MITRQRLERLLGKHRFIASFEDKATEELVFVRKSLLSPSLFERIALRISRSPVTKRWDHATAWCQIAIVPGRTAVKGLCESRHIARLPFSTSRGSSSLKDEETAREWQAVLAEIAPTMVGEMADSKGSSLLQQTEAIRVAASAYLSRVGRGASSEQLVQSFSKSLPLQQREALQTINLHHVVLIPGAIAAYQLALALVYRFADVVEPDQLRLDHRDPTGDVGLVLRLQVLASHLSKEIGWEEEERNPGVGGV